MTGPARVLIVDDDEDLRELMSAVLRTSGHSTIAAEDGKAALLALAADSGVRLIVLDLQMPVMDGRTFLAHKARGAHSAIPVIIFTSSPALGLKRFPDVVAVVSKGAGVDGLLSAIAGTGGFDARHESGT
jgi:CheY-like chemotaxis protein